MVVVLVGNKCDLSTKRAVTYDEGLMFANENGLIFMEASAKENINVESLFSVAAADVYAKIVDGSIDITGEDSGVRLGTTEELGREKSGCCGRQVK